MPRKFRLTCARTTYFDIDMTAESAADAERLLEAAILGDAGLGDGTRPIGRPIHRIVDVAASEAEASADPREEAA
jgi:hypothetical protein